MRLLTAQPFHNDVCDILAMYVQETAAEGGESHLASCAAVYNEIAAERPDVIHTLADGSWVFDKQVLNPHHHTHTLTTTQASYSCILEHQAPTLPIWQQGSRFLLLTTSDNRISLVAKGCGCASHD
jgi:hypothetical protein